MQKPIEQTNEAVDVVPSVKPAASEKPTRFGAPGCFLTIDGELAVQLNKRVLVFGDGKYLPHELGEPVVAKTTPSVRLYEDLVTKKPDEVCIGEAFWYGGVNIKVTNKKCVVNGELVDKIYPYLVRVFGKLEF